MYKKNIYYILPKRIIMLNLPHEVLKDNWNLTQKKKYSLEKIYLECFWHFRRENIFFHFFIDFIEVFISLPQRKLFRLNKIIWMIQQPCLLENSSTYSFFNIFLFFSGLLFIIHNNRSDSIKQFFLIRCLIHSISFHRFIKKYFQFFFFNSPNFSIHLKASYKYSCIQHIHIYVYKS